VQHQRPGLLVSAQRGKALAHSATEARRAQRSKQPAVAEHGVVGVVGGEQGYVNTASDQPLGQMVQVPGARAEGAVLVFHLDHDDRAARVASLGATMGCSASK
jgi:hypothetical protein